MNVEQFAKNTNCDKLTFPPNKHTFINHTKNIRKTILILSTFCILLFFISFPFGLWKHLNGQTNIVGYIGIMFFICAIFGYIYYAIRYYDKTNRIFQGHLYYYVHTNILFFETNIHYYPFYADKSNFDDIDVRFINQFLRRLKFGIPNVDKVLYSIPIISHILVKKDYIILYGDIVMTSYSATNIKTALAHSKTLRKMKIPRGYDRFEALLISNQYLGTENLH